ncbi:VAMP-like protein YKT61 isoform X1 [Vitis riparia]|uniref:VAMP-like protein YKT61 isoform X1 n=1 Tax=Vitis riparia TaxID=96939 RepID=UPI00053F809E|nr:VAMP-like protein YKT61 isoform X1 [Vitis riparia]|eukprot:XP_010659784.1 PREDICTED: VAMP-like protein YKT61 isoform X1 [Vitis vinifera]
MKITALLVMKWQGDSIDPVILANACDVSQFGYFQRSGAKEFIVFVGRTVAKRTPPAQRQSVQHQEYKVHSYNRNGLCALGFMDDNYPVRSAFSLLNKVLEEYQKNFGDSWRNAQADVTQPWPYLNEALTKFQDPAEADKLLKIQRDLDETKIILHMTIDSVLARGEKLDSLVEKSSDLSMASQTDLIVALEADVLQAGKENQPVLHHIIGLQEEDESKGLAVHGGNFLGKSY